MKPGEPAVCGARLVFQGQAIEGATMYEAGFITDDEVDAEFARGAAEYLRRAGLDVAEICRSLVSELGLDRTEAQRFAQSAA